MIDPEKTKKLLEVLKAGKILSKIHHNDPECEETIGYDEYFYIGGWGTAYGIVRDRVVELIEEPELWNIKE